MSALLALLLWCPAVLRSLPGPHDATCLVAYGEPMACVPGHWL